MRLIRLVRLRFHSLFRTSAAEANMQKELDLHLEQLTQEYVSNGMNLTNAKLAARREFGSLELAKEQCRDTRAVSFFQDRQRDLIDLVTLVVTPAILGSMPPCQPIGPRDVLPYLTR